MRLLGAYVRNIGQDLSEPSLKWRTNVVIKFESYRKKNLTTLYNRIDFSELFSGFDCTNLTVTKIKMDSEARRNTLTKSRSFGILAREKPEEIQLVMR